MNTHLTDDLLIQLQFDLLDVDAVETARAHLQACADCQHRAEALAQKFQSLDLVKEEMAVSQELLDKVLADSANTVSRSRIWLIRYSVAAVILIGVAFAASTFVRQYNQQRKHDTYSTTPDDSKPFERPTPLTEEKTFALQSPAGSESSAFHSSGKPGEPTVVGLLTDSDIDSTPPFAPASAIELVTLPPRNELQLTIYNSADLTLVRERRNLTLKRGWNWLQLMWANTRIDPTSLTLEPLEQKDKVLVQQLVYPARLKQIGRWLIRSEITDNVPMEVTYLTSGIAWRAFYMGTLTPDESKMKLDGFVRVDNNSGEEYEEAQTRLVVGQVHLLEQITELSDREWAWGRHSIDDFSVINGPAMWDDSSEKLNVLSLNGDMAFGLGRDGGMMGGMGGFGGGLMRIKKVLKEGLSEYNLYTIEGLETIPHEWGKRLPSFKADEIPVESVYKYDPSRWGAETIQFLSFANDKEHKLGDNALPEGDMKIFRDTGDAYRLAYIGASAAKYIPVNEKVELDLGATPYVKIEPVVMDQKTDNYRFDRDGNIAGWDDIQAWKVTITNTREIPVSVEYFQNFDTQYWKLKRIHEIGTYEQEDLDTAKFTLILEPRSKTIFEYTTAIFRGTREEDWKL